MGQGLWGGGLEGEIVHPGEPGGTTLSSTLSGRYCGPGHESWTLPVWGRECVRQPIGEATGDLGYSPDTSLQTASSLGQGFPRLGLGQVPWGK